MGTAKGVDFIGQVSKDAAFTQVRCRRREEMFSKSVLPYRSPYDLLVEIIEEQFDAEVVGTI